MKKYLVPSLFFLVVAAQAQVTWNGPFTAPPAFNENFDSIAAGSYAGLPVFGVPAVALQIGTGVGLDVQPQVGNPSLPHCMYGNRVDVRIISAIPMRRFGGLFRSGFIGLFSPTARFVFYDSSNNVIGVQTATMTTAWSWVGSQTIPKWNRVDILGAIPGVAGCIGMDDLVMRPN